MPRSPSSRRKSKYTRARENPRGEVGERLGGMPRLSPDGQFLVSPFHGRAGDKVYTCPGCLQRLPETVSHVVVWPASDGHHSPDIAARRHWHTACWQRRLRGVR